MKTTQLSSTINQRFNSPSIPVRPRIGLAFMLAAALLCSLPNASAKTLAAGPGLVHIAAGNTQVWGIDGGNNVYQYSGGTFNLIPGVDFKQIAVGLDTDVWGLSPKGHAFQWDASTKTFNAVSPSLAFKQIATGKGGTWAITTEIGRAHV